MPQGEHSCWQKNRSSEQSREQGQAGQRVVAPSQVTDPRCPPPQLLSAAEQLVVLLFPWQLMVLPSQQVAEALQSAFSPTLGSFAAGTGAGVAREARKAWSAELGTGAAAAIAGEMKNPRAADARTAPIVNFLMGISFLTKPSI